MKFFNKTLLLAVACAMIVFSAGCVAKARRPVPPDTDTIGGATNVQSSTTNDSTNNNAGYSTAPIGGPAGAYNAGQFSAVSQNVFPANTSANTSSTQASDTFSERPEGGTLLNGQIRGIPSLQPVFFDFDRYAIKTSEYGKIQALKDYLAKNPTQRVLIEGNCDWRGTTEYNMALGEKRANAVRRYAISIGIPAAKIQTLSLGSSKATERGTEAEMSKDRRGEIVILVK